MSEINVTPLVDVMLGLVIIQTASDRGYGALFGRETAGNRGIGVHAVEEAIHDVPGVISGVTCALNYNNSVSKLMLIEELNNPT